MHIALQVMRLAQGLEKAAKRVFAPHGLTPAQFNVLNLLAVHKGGLRGSDLARELVVDPSNITGLLKRMVAGGLVRDVDHGGDRRQRVVGMTGEGRARWVKANRDYQHSLRLLEQALEPRSRKLTEEALCQLREVADGLSR